MEEMNKTKIKGKPISVELVSNPSENRSLDSRILGKKLWSEAVSVASSASSDQNEALPSASGSVGAPGTSPASQKVPLLPRASSPAPCSAQLPSEAKCLKSSAEDSVRFLFAVNQKVINDYCISFMWQIGASQLPSSNVFYLLLTEQC